MSPETRISRDRSRKQPLSRPEAGTDPTGDERLARIWEQAYAARTRDDLRELYASWAESYDQDHEKVGFFAHRLTAEVLARHLTRRDVARILDAGAGTGAAGTALHELGFRDLLAVDLSPEMLRVAEGKGIYRDTLVCDLSLPVDSFAESSFDGAVLVGVFSYGQAPAETLDEMLRLVRPGGVIAFTARTDFLEEDAMGVASRMAALERDGSWSLLERTEPARYLPHKDPEALFRVFCYRVTGSHQDQVEEGFEDAVRESFETDAYVKRIDHAWIWDSTASRLYERYTRTAGYYLTDCEEEILRENAGQIWSGEPFLVELGCGSARKIRHVLEAALAGGARALRYMPIDVSPGALRSTVAEVERTFGQSIALEPRQGLFEDVLSSIAGDERKLVFFFGSSIGNLESLEETAAFLRRLHDELRPGDRLIVGTDLHKDEDVIERAYNEEDACRAFFVHMLRRINEHLGADFDPRVFELSSTYELEPSWKGVTTRRVNLRIAPTVPQRTLIRTLELEVSLEPGQPVQVGISRKYEPRSFARVAELAGFRAGRHWYDSRRWFALNELIPV